MRNYLYCMGLGMLLGACHGREHNKLGEGTSFHVGSGYPKSFQLPDGSTVMVNPGSTVAIAKGFGKDNREVDVDGEAVFSVVGMAGMYGRPFIVHTRDLVIEVLDSVGLSGGHFHND